MTGPANGPLWRNRDFLVFWSGQAFSVLGTAVSRVAIPWLILDLTGSAAHTGAMLAVGLVAYYGMAMPAGVWVDRLDRRRIMIGADLLRAVVIGSVPLAAFFGRVSLAQLYVVQAVVSATSALFDMGYIACLPNLVGRDQLQAANSRLQATDSLAYIAGPAIAGVLIGLVGAAGTVSVNSLSFIGSAASLLLIKGPFQAAGTAGRNREPFIKDLVEGLRFVWRHPVLRSLVVVFAALNLSGGVSEPVEMFRLKEELGFSADLVGLILGVGGVGSLLGAVAAEPASRRYRLGGILTAGLVGFFGAAILLALARWPSVFMVAVFVRAASVVVVNVQSISVRQGVTPDHLLGRVTGAFRTLVGGVAPAGNILGGLGGQRWGAVPVLWTAAAVLLVSLAAAVATGLSRVKSPGEPV